MPSHSLLIHQVLHGYDDGHRLLRSSLELPNEARREMLVLSDLSGQRDIRGFQTYVTGYGLQDSSLYVLARTWPAPEMKRPGCVWTHSLLLDFSDLARQKHLGHMRALFSLWNRPEQSRDWAPYAKPVTFDIDGSNTLYPTTWEVDTLAASFVLSGLYEHPNAPVLVAARDSEQYQDLVLQVWLQQWPRLRRSFTFCTGASSCRFVYSKPFDLQIVPQASLSTLRREVPNACLVEVPELGEGVAPQASQARWLRCAVEDLRAASPQPREFLRLFGSNTSRPRARFAPLADIFERIKDTNNALLSNDNEGGDALLLLVEAVAHHFPKPMQAARLKLAAFGVVSPNEVLAAPEEQMLEALALSPDHGAFDAAALSIRGRASLLWEEHPDQAERLLHRLTRQSSSPLVEEVIAGVADAVDAGEALTLLRRIPHLAGAFMRLNSSLATSPGLWRGPVDLQRELFDALERHALPDWDRGAIAGAVFAARADAMAAEVLERLGAAALPPVLEWLERGGRHLSPEWRSALATQPTALVEWLEHGTHRTQLEEKWVDAALQVLGALHPHAKAVQKIAPGLWVELADATVSRLAQTAGKKPRPLSVATFFLLSLGLRSEAEQGQRLIERCFEPVHDDLAAGEFDYFAWKWLEKDLPPVPFNDWDRCERLRRGVLHRFVGGDWPASALLRAIGRPSTLEFMILSCGHTEEGRRLLKQLKRLVETKDAKILPWQAEVLLKRRRKGFLGLG